MIKKSMRITLALLAIFSSQAFADASTSQGEMMSAYDAANNGAYVQVEIGAADRNWNSSFPGIGFSRNPWGFTYGGEIGYQWSRFLAAEAGTFLMADSSFVFNNQSFGARSWTVDLAGKLMLPIPSFQRISPFVKAGAAYRNTQINGFFHVFGDFVPLVAGGLQYNATTNLYMDLQWAYLAQGSSLTILTRRSHIPAYNVVTFGLGYKFTFF